MELLSKGIGGIKWVSVGRFSRQIIQFITSIYLARILVPEDFGIVAIALIFFGFLTTFKDFGIGSAIIYVEDFDYKLFSTAFFINLFLSTLLGGITFLLASQIAWLLSPDLKTTEQLVPIIKFFSMFFVFNGITSLYQAVIEREMLFNKLAIIEMISTFIGAVTAIVLAILYANVWSLIAQISVSLLINGILLFFFSPMKPKLIFSIEKMKIIVEYSSRLSAYSFVNYIIRNVDYFLIGKFLGATPLGYYALAYRIILYPVINISNVISRVMLPIYARLKNDNKLFQDIFKSVSYLIYLIVLPYFVFLLIFSNEFVIYFLSDKWEPIVVLISILGPVGIIQATSVTTGSIYQALGKTQTLLLWGGFSGVVFIISFILGLQFGVLGVAIGYLIANIVIGFHWFNIPFKFIHLKVSEYLLNFKNIFIVNLGIAITMILMKYFIYNNFQNIYLLIFLIAICICLYIILYYKYLWDEIQVQYNLLKGNK